MNKDKCEKCGNKATEDDLTDYGNVICKECLELVCAKCKFLFAEITVCESKDLRYCRECYESSGFYEE